MKEGDIILTALWQSSMEKAEKVMNLTRYKFSVALLKKPLSWFLERAPVWRPLSDVDRKGSTSAKDEETIGLTRGYLYELTEYSTGVFMEVNEEAVLTKYTTHPYTLIQQYLAATPEESPICLNVWENGTQDACWYITAEGRWRLDYDMLEDMTVRAARFFRERCCVVCEYDVLSEGGVHAQGCPVGVLLGPTYVSNRLFTLKTKT